MQKKQDKLDDMMQKLKEEKRMLATKKQSKQLDLNDAPKKIKIEKKKSNVV
ncbi:hypothetical protein HOK00_02440 [bacterium]|nr:hypothetical protein [bacterium]